MGKARKATRYGLAGVFLALVMSGSNLVGAAAPAPASSTITHAVADSLAYNTQTGNDLNTSTPAVNWNWCAMPGTHLVTGSTNYPYTITAGPAGPPGMEAQQVYIRCTAPNLGAVIAGKSYSNPTIITNISSHTVELQLNQSGHWVALAPNHTQAFTINALWPSSTAPDYGSVVCSDWGTQNNVHLATFDVPACRVTNIYSVYSLQMYVPDWAPLIDGRAPFSIGIEAGYPLATAPAPVGTCTQGIPADMTVGIAATPDGKGYWIASQDGRVAACGDAPALGDATPPAPVAAIAAAPTGVGYWLVTTTGMVYAFGSAVWHGQPITLNTTAPARNGSMVSHVAKPVTAMTADPKTGGYWLLDTAGNVYSFDAPYYGGAGTGAAAGIASATGGTGYWIVDTAGRVTSRGSAHNWGSANGAVAVGITTDQATGGYWVVTSKGAAEPFHASTLGASDSSLTVGLSALATGDGYFFVSATGRVYNFGSASAEGSAN